VEYEKQIDLLKNRIKELERQVYLLKHDQLTGFGNRHKLEEALKYYEDMVFDVHPDIEFIVYMIDVNGLHSYNREYGYEAGDAYLLSIVRQINEIINKTSALPFRIGGDEFLIIAYEYDSENLKELCSLQNATVSMRTWTKGIKFSEVIRDLDKEIIMKKAETR